MSEIDLNSAPMDGALVAKRIIVTGGANGLGAAIVELLLDAGADPQVLDREPPTADVAFFQTDVSDRSQIEAAVGEVARGGGIDAVVTAAGIDRPGPLDGLPAADWEQVIAVNLFGTVGVVRAALPELKRSHGRVVTVASTLALRGAGDATAYCASKFGVLGFTRALAAETAGQVGVTALVPGGMDTGFFDGREEQYRPQDRSHLAPPDQVAQAALFALSRPHGVEVRELLVFASTETSWP